MNRSKVQKNKVRQSERGAAAVEVALSLLPFMLILTSGIAAILSVTSLAAVERAMVKSTNLVGLGTLATVNAYLNDANVGLKRQDSVLNNISPSNVRFFVVNGDTSDLEVCSNNINCVFDDYLVRGQPFYITLNYQVPILPRIAITGSFLSLKLDTTVVGRYEPDFSGHDIIIGGR